MMISNNSSKEFLSWSLILVIVAVVTDLSIVTRESTAYSVQPDDQVRQENVVMLPQRFPESSPNPAKEKPVIEQIYQIIPAGTK
jgi:hypothetical protein